VGVRCSVLLGLELSPHHVTMTALSISRLEHTALPLLYSPHCSDMAHEAILFSLEYRDAYLGTVR
jgi:hypothetical protein